MTYTFITPDYNLSCDKRAEWLIKILSQKDEVLSVASPLEAKGVENPVIILPFFMDDNSAAHFLTSAPEGCQVFGGHEGILTRAVINERGLFYRDVLNEEAFCKDNALITAEAALGLIINSTSTTIHSMRVAILGYGRIGQRLCRMLLALGASVVVFSSSDEELALAKTRGIASCHLWQREKMNAFMTVVNTIPLRHVIDRDTLEKMSPDAYVLDLASGENNVNWATLHSLGIKGEKAGSLPQKVSPRSAAVALKNSIFRQLN